MADDKKIALITGASSGLGKALAGAFAYRHYDLILSGRNKRKLKETKEAVAPCAGECEVVVGDITSDVTIDSLEEAAKEWGIDVLINNAGIYAEQELERMAPAAIRRMIDTNLVAPILLTRRLFPLFRNARSGLIININSVAGKEPSDKESVYCATKAGLRGFTRSLQFEATYYGIRVMEFFLGAMATPMTRGRVSFDKLVDPVEVAAIMAGLSTEHVSVRLKEIDIGRKNY